VALDQFSKNLQVTIQRAKEFHQLLNKGFLPNTIAFRLEWDSNVRPAIGYSPVQIGLQHLGGLLVLVDRGLHVSGPALETEDRSTRPRFVVCVLR